MELVLVSFYIRLKHISIWHSPIQMNIIHLKYENKKPTGYIAGGKIPLGNHRTEYHVFYLRQRYI